MKVELLWWEGCPSHPQALADLRAAVGDRAVVEPVEVTSDEEAQALGFPGSPTIRVGGADLFPTDEPAGLTCRVYYLRDGRPSPTPDPEELRERLQVQLARHER